MYLQYLSFQFENYTVEKLVIIEFSESHGSRPVDYRAFIYLAALDSCAFASLDLISKYNLQVPFQGPKYFLCYVFRAY